MRKSILILVTFIAVFFLTGCIGQKTVKVDLTPTPTPDVKILKEGEGPKVELIPAANRQYVTLKMSGFSSDIKSADYEIVYETNGMQRGIVGSVVLTPGLDKIEKKHDLGSCSKNVCVFDKNITNLQLTVKFETGGVPLQFQKEYSL